MGCSRLTDIAWSLLPMLTFVSTFVRWREFGWSQLRCGTKSKGQGGKRLSDASSTLLYVIWSRHMRIEPTRHWPMCWVEFLMEDCFTVYPVLRGNDQWEMAHWVLPGMMC